MSTPTTAPHRLARALAASGCAAGPLLALLWGTASPALLRGLVAVWLALAAAWLGLALAGAWLGTPTAQPVSRWYRAGLAGAGLLLLASLLTCLLPPALRDELSHHLAVARLWLRAGTLRPIAGLVVSYFPAWTETLYAGALAWHAEGLAKLIHWLLGLGVLLLPLTSTQAGDGGGGGDRGRRATWLYLALLWLLTPAFYALLGAAYSDLGALLAIFAALLHWARWLDGPTSAEKRRALALAALLLGLAVAMKYTALPAAGALALLSVAEVLRRRWRGGELAPYRDLPALCLLALAPAVHFWINARATGNPIYPLLHTLWTGHPAGTGLPLSHWDTRALLYGEGPLEQLLIPVRVFLTGLAGSPGRFDGVLNPLWLCWPLLFFWASRRPAAAATQERTDRLLALLWAIISFLSFAFASARARYYLPALAPLALLFLRRGPRIEWTPPRRRTALALLLLGGLFGLSHNVYHLTRVDLAGYLASGLDREAYLRSHVAEYAITQKANQRLPAGARLYPLLLGNRIYYLDPEVYLDTGFRPDLLETLCRDSATPEQIARGLGARGITHLLYPGRPLRETLRADLGPAAYGRAARFFQRHCRDRAREGPFHLCALSASE